MSETRTIQRLFLLVAASLLTACASSGKALPEVAAEINATLYRGDTLLAPGDLLEVRFAQEVRWDQLEIRVRPDGKASFLSVGDVEVAGKTVEELAKELAGSYVAILQKPELTVFLKEPAARTVVVMGEVHDQGAVEIQGGHMSLVQALGLAGGPSTLRADLGRVLLTRWMAQEGKRRAWIIDASREYWQSPDPILLQPFDVVYVAHKGVIAVDEWIDTHIRRIIPFPQFIPLAP